MSNPMSDDICPNLGEGNICSGSKEVVDWSSLVYLKEAKPKTEAYWSEWYTTLTLLGLSPVQDLQRVPIWGLRDNLSHGRCWDWLGERKVHHFVLWTAGHTGLCGGRLLMLYRGYNLKTVGNRWGYQSRTNGSMAVLIPRILRVYHLTWLLS